jgi:hypothetical protein
LLEQRAKQLATDIVLLTGMSQFNSALSTIKEQSHSQMRKFLHHNNEVHSTVKRIKNLKKRVFGVTPDTRERASPPRQEVARGTLTTMEVRQKSTAGTKVQRNKRILIDA